MKAHWESKQFKKTPTNTLIFHKKMSWFTLLTELSCDTLLTEALASCTITINMNRAYWIALTWMTAATRKLRVTIIAKRAPTQGGMGH